jgi:5-methylcytosine-specific restriction endonuclease McrBC GTP-binding regulatory subunit McrB
MTANTPPKPSEGESASGTHAAPIATIAANGQSSSPTQHNYGSATETKIQQIIDACGRYGEKAIIALAGVPGTGKSFIASIAAQRFTNEPTLVREIQFHQSFSYEEFIEGMRIDITGGVSVSPGIFLDWNRCALDDPRQRYVLLVEELTRANISAVLGELMTYLEYRERPFISVYSRQPTYIAKNLTLLATYNPMDRSALEIDAALLRRMRVIAFPPSPEQLGEMLGDRQLSGNVVARLKAIFTKCKEKFPEEYDHLMPFGHGIFSDIQQESPDLYRLWVERITLLLRRPLVAPHPFTDTIETLYPWRDPSFVVPD